MKNGASKKKGAVKKTAKKKVAKKAKAPKKKVAPKAKAPKKKVAPTVKAPKKKRKPNPAFMKPFMPSPELAAVVGDKPLPRPQITKKLWAYIKANNLQDTFNRRMINADSKLQVVFGGKPQVSMFEMTALVSKHLS
ncbi:MAG: SWIB/MDM2 domain-containing protein [Planctomycetota bacterium]